MIKKLLYAILLTAFGFMGGLLALHLFSFQYIEKFLIKRESDLPPIQLIEAREVVITENEAIVDAIKNVRGAIVGVKSPGAEGSGIIIASDGLVVTLAELVPVGAPLSFYINDKALPYQVQKRDLADNLALVKINGNNFPTLEFAADEPKIGETVFIVGAIFGNQGAQEQLIKSVNKGIVRRIEGGRIVTDMVEEKRMSGSALFDVRGRVLGIVAVSEKGKVAAVPISLVREFAGL